MSSNQKCEHYYHSEVVKSRHHSLIECQSAGIIKVMFASTKVLVMLATILVFAFSFVIPNATATPTGRSHFSQEHTSGDFLLSCGRKLFENHREEVEAEEGMTDTAVHVDRNKNNDNDNIHLSVVVTIEWSTISILVTMMAIAIVISYLVGRHSVRAVGKADSPNHNPIRNHTTMLQGDLQEQQQIPLIHARFIPSCIPYAEVIQVQYAEMVQYGGTDGGHRLE